MVFGLFGSNKKELTSKDYEKKILQTQGFVIDEDVFIRDIELPESGGHIHSIEVGRGNPDKLLLIHGYGATGVFYWKVLRQLKDHFHIFAIDLYGKGNSSRPPFKDFSYQATCSFFCDAIHEMTQILGFNEYSLGGHSFGGYIAVQLLRTKNPCIKRLFLISPAGFTYKSKEEVYESLKSRGLGKFFLKMGTFVNYLIDSHKYTPFQLMNIAGKKRSIIKYYKSPRLKLKPWESYLFGNYYYLIQSMPISGDKALSVFLHYGRYSKQPLVDQLSCLKREGRLPPVSVFYGDNDWMDKDHSVEESIKRDLQIDFQFLPECGHQIVFQRPLLLARVIAEKMGKDFIPVHVNSQQNIQRFGIFDDTEFELENISEENEVISEKIDGIIEPKQPVAT